MPWLCSGVDSINGQLETAWFVHQVLEALGLRYAIIGGIAVQHWGHPRFTRDLDLTLLVEPGKERDTAQQLLEHLEARIPDAAAFAIENRVLLAKHADCDVDVDISFGIPGYEEEVVANTGALWIDEHRRVWVCSIEDLIIHKAISGRPRDREDLEALVARNGESIDADRVRLWLREFAAILETDEPVHWFEGAWGKPETK